MVLAAAVVVSSASALRTKAHRVVGPIAGFSLLRRGPDGGTAWQGAIADTVVPHAAAGHSIVYLPPHFSPARRYPVVYVLHGMPGSPYSVVDSMALTDIADRLVTAGELQPFVAVIPAGPRSHYDGEWAGPWERFVVDDVVSWADRHLPVETDAVGRTLAGYSAGGFGAVDIGLRNPGAFGTLEAWSGYFQPPQDGPFRGVSVAVLRANDPMRIARRDVAALRRRGVWFFLSVGTTGDRWTEGVTLRYAGELRALRLPYRLWLAPGGHDGAFWRAQLPAALEFAVPAVYPAMQNVAGLLPASLRLQASASS